MPGAKRKYDEDTWMGTQSKKFKCGILIANVYASTLAQLRLGSRNFFNNTTSTSTPLEAGSPGSNNPGNQSPPGNGGSSRPTLSPPPPGGPSSPFHSPPASPLMRDVLSHNDINPVLIQNQRPAHLCFNCSFKRDGWEKCYYCEKVVCHLNPCEGGCNEGYCHNCCITKYDNPSGETYACFGCLH